MQIEIAPSAALQLQAADPNMPQNPAQLPYGYLDLPEVPWVGDTITLPDGRSWTVVRRHWYPGTNKPPTVILQ